MSKVRRFRLKLGEDCRLESTSRLNRWLTRPGRGTARYWRQPRRIKHRGRVFEVLTPRGAGKTLFRKAFKFGGCRASKAEGAAGAGRSSRKDSAPAPEPSGATRLAAGRRRGTEGRAARAPAPPPSGWMPPPFGLDGAPGRAPASASWLGSAPAGARLVDGSCPRPHCPLPLCPQRAHRKGWPGSLDGAEPWRVPRPSVPA